MAQNDKLCCNDLTSNFYTAQNYSGISNKYYSFHLASTSSAEIDTTKARKEFQLNLDTTKARKEFQLNLQFNFKMYNQIV